MNWMKRSLCLELNLLGGTHQGVLDAFSGTGFRLFQSVQALHVACKICSETNRCLIAVMSLMVKKWKMQSGTTSSLQQMKAILGVLYMKFGYQSRIR